MTIVQTIEIQPNHRLVLNLPLELPVGRAEIALTVTPEENVSTVNEKSAFGCLHSFAALEKIDGEKGAWERAVIEKHEKN